MADYNGTDEDDIIDASELDSDIGNIYPGKGNDTITNAKSGQILVSESVYLEVVDYGIFDFQRLDSIFVKGKENEVSIFSLVKCNCSPKVIAAFDLVLELLLKLAPELYYHSI